MIDLRQIENYINSLLNSADIATNKMLLAALEKIRLHIESYKETKSSRYLLEIRCFIESIKLISLSKSFSLFGSQNDNCTSMGDILAKNNFSVITHPSMRAQICDRNGMSDLTLSRSAEQILGWIYQTITLKLPISTIAWDATFAANETGIIYNDQISAWQTHMQIITSPQQAVRDFRRDIKIMGRDPKTFTSDEDAIAQLESLIAKSNYPEEEKARIKAWLLAKGGQEMNFFISDMIKCQTLFKVPDEMLNPEHTNILASRGESSDNNWDLDSNGKIVYYQNFHLKSVCNGSECILARTSKGTVKIIHDDHPDYEEALLNSTSKAKDYLASINTHAGLDITENSITPVILSLNVISQTDIISPAGIIRPAAEAAAVTGLTLQRPHSSRF